MKILEFWLCFQNSCENSHLFSQQPRSQGSLLPTLWSERVGWVGDNPENKVVLSGPRAK